MSFPHYWSPLYSNTIPPRSLSLSPDYWPDSVKEEQDESVARFIMEISPPQAQSASLAPPTEVPLRATQAPPEMRSMMGVFRLNPFAMHSGEGRGTVAPTWCGEEAHPLDQEPIIFEFQLELEDALKEPLRSFSPDFELHHEQDSDELLEPDQNDWPDSYHSESVYCDSTSTPPIWELDYPPTTDDNFSSPDPAPIHFQPRQSSRLYESTSFNLPSSSPLDSSAFPPQFHSSTFKRTSSTLITQLHFIQPQLAWPRPSIPIECHARRTTPGLRLVPAMSLFREVPCTRPILPAVT